MTNDSTGTIYSGQLALLQRHYRGTTTPAVVVRTEICSRFRRRVVIPRLSALAECFYCGRTTTAGTVRQLGLSEQSDDRRRHGEMMSESRGASNHRCSRGARVERQFSGAFPNPAAEDPLGRISAAEYQSAERGGEDSVTRSRHDYLPSSPTGDMISAVHDFFLVFSQTQPPE